MSIEFLFCRTQQSICSRDVLSAVSDFLGCDFSGRGMIFHLSSNAETVARPITANGTAEVASDLTRHVR